jgi:S-DNA-T family DNA segregation ATPase FtsK/SpoIIIE
MVGGRSEQLLGRYAHWTVAMRRGGHGLLLGPRLDVDGEIFGLRLPRSLGVSPAKGRGLLYAGGTCRVVQVAGADLGY